MIYGVDFGTGNALAIHGPDGPVSKRDLNIPRVKGGRTMAMEFVFVAEALLQTGDVVVESATIGSSGCEVQDVIDMISRVPHKLFTVSCRAIKNYRLDNGLPFRKGGRYAKDGQAPAVISLEEQAVVHTEDAEILYKIATETPHRLHHWTGPSETIERQFTSVRPMDKRGYRDDRALRFLDLIPPYDTLPEELKCTFGNGKAYYAAAVMPFAMATQEPHVDAGPVEERRRRYEKVIGLYDRGYPSYYRRATINLMQQVAKDMAMVPQFKDVDRATRKAALRVMSRHVRQFFHLCMEHQGR